ncbi:MAG: dihydroorotate dehydrogenase electron transfer subunit [Candidatus Omnitrophota bacterium]|jgi:dihydroorotate dehydrogenase electron transfer subunit|nr:dihydroorotate dehydrogenase electron transfer subunit [Candidatus Omnitrophota bacterium]
MEKLQIKTKIISNKKLKNNYWHLEFESGLIAGNAVPGQFIEVKVNYGTDPLLRRPISIHKVNKAGVKLLYEVVGRGTQILSEKRPGDLLDVIGPLGNGFEYLRKTARADSTQVVLVAGGMGVAPLVFLAEKIKSFSPLVLVGARKKEQVLCSREFKALGCKLIIATDDGSLGFKGKVTDLLKEILSKESPADRPINIYACGPQPMLKAVAQISCENNIPSQLSLERHMACGFGACLGCVVPTKAGYKRVCKDGPVFLGKELIW